MIKILHLSDLHFYKNDGQTYSMQKILVKEAKKDFEILPKGQKILIITGDFHNYHDNYDMAVTFLKELINAMGLDRTKDVFVIPGNHDVGDDELLKNLNIDPEDTAAYTSMLKSGKMQYLEKKMKSYLPYCEFVRRIGIYSKTDDIFQPVRVHVRQWQGKRKLNILHLNTTLSADGSPDKSGQMTDVSRAENPATWEGFSPDDTPAIALGHNHFKDLNENDQTSLQRMFYLYNVSAYLCGDTHRVETDTRNQLIALECGSIQGRLEIPNLVCAKSIGDKEDNYSDFGYYIHEWDENTGHVNVIFKRWRPKDLSQTFTDESARGSYQMRPFSSSASSESALKKSRNKKANNSGRKKGGLAVYFETVPIHSININPSDYKNREITIIWPVIPRKAFNSIHCAQLELIRLLYNQYGWSVKCLITELCIDPKIVTENDIIRFRDTIRKFCKKNRINIDFISLNDKHILDYSDEKEKQIDELLICKDIFDMLGGATITALRDINEKNYAEKDKKEVNDRKVLEYVLPLLQLAAIKYLSSEKKIVIIAGNDEHYQWITSFDIFGANLSAMLIPEINIKKGENIFQQGRSHKDALNCYSKQAVMKYAKNEEVCKWYYKMFFCLPTQREVDINKKENTEEEWEEIFKHISSIIYP